MAVKTDIKTFAAIGTGVIGSGWISRALAHGLDVVVWDPAPGAEERLRANVANAWPRSSASALRRAPTPRGCVSSRRSRPASPTRISSRKARPSARR